MHPITTTLLAIVALTVILATLLWVAQRTLKVPSDERVDVVEAMLPHTNCGACGYPGCRPFAEALVGGEASPGGCTVSLEAGRARIAAYLGVSVGEVEKRVARLACAGGTNVARLRAHYKGLESCAAAALVGGGGKGCVYGCVGLGDCERACTFDAIAMNEHELPVVDEDRCTACGDCVTACPKDLFSLVPSERRLFVRCKSELAGDAALRDCDVACNACGRCAMDAPRLVTMHRNLPLINLRVPHAPDAIGRCPTGAIVWIDDDGGDVKGSAAPTFTRHAARSAAPT